MKRVQSLFREAQAKKQRRDVEEETKKRDELLLRKQKRRQLRAGELPDSEETSVQAAKDSTDALRRARQMMHQELEKGETTLMQMTESSNTMKKTDLEYDTHSGTLKDGSQLIQTLEKQAKKERIVLWLGFFCFVTACLHVVLKRTPVLARFHPRLYFSKTKNNDTNHHHKKIDIDEKKSHHQSESESGKNPPPPRREEYAYKPTMNDDEYNQNAEL
jgi:protein transport protein SEC20